MLRMSLTVLLTLGFLSAPAPAQDGLMEERPDPAGGVDPEPALELPERVTREAPAGHPILFEFGDMLERMHDRNGPGRPEELIARLSGTARFTNELSIATDAHARAITGTAVCEPILNGRGVRLTLDGQVAIGAANFPYVSEALILYDHDAAEYVCYQRDSLAAQIVEMRGDMNADESELTLTAAGQSGDIAQVILFSESGISEIRNYLRPLGMEEYAFRGLTTFEPIEEAAEPERFLVTYVPAWGEPDADGVYPPMPESNRTVYARHLRHLRELANNGMLERSGAVGSGEQIVLMRAPDGEVARAAAERNPAVAAGLFTVRVRPYEPLYADPAGG
ncbi:MAG: DUF1579 family protein [Phycisphaerales bacterium]